MEGGTPSSEEQMKKGKRGGEETEEPAARKWYILAGPGTDFVVQ
jgi:hypothetical protein